MRRGATAIGDGAAPLRNLGLTVAVSFQALTDALAGVVGKDRLLTDSASLARCAVDGVLPAWVVQPTGVNDVSGLLKLAAEHIVHFQLASGRLGNIQAVRASRVEIHLLQDQNVSIYADEEVCRSGRWFRYGCTERAGSHTGSPGYSIKLRPRPGRESHRSIVLDPAQSELADAPVQRETS